MAVAVRVVIAYDVSMDRRRARLSALLASWGDRVQKSVFECSLEPSELFDVLARASSMIDADTDSLRVYRQCVDCGRDATTFGQATVVSPDPYWVV